jgi:hypothetical protein
VGKGTYDELRFDPEFVSEAARCGTPEELRALAARHGLDVTLGEAAAALERLRELTDEGELQQGELDAVSGGVLPGDIDLGHTTHC